MSTASTIAGELLILLASDKDRVDGPIPPQVITTAVLAELLVEGRIKVSSTQDPKISLRDKDEPLEEPILKTALRALKGKDGKRASELLSSSKFDLTERIAEKLLAGGYITLRKGFLGESWAYADQKAARKIAKRLAKAVKKPKKATERDAVLVRLLAGRQVARTVLTPHLEDMDEQTLISQINVLTSSKKVSGKMRRLVDAGWTATHS